MLIRPKTKDCLKINKEMEKSMEKRYKKAVSLEAFIFLVIFLLIFGGIAMKMGGANMMQTLMATAYELLIDTVFNIMAIAVIAGALSGVLSEFGVIALLNKAITPLMKPLYNLPGAASVGVMTTYLSDNPAILGLAEDRNFRRYFKKFQLPALTNLGTAFGMGLIVTTFMLGINAPGENLGLAVLIGNLGAIIGSIVSVRIMMIFTKKEFGVTEYCIPAKEGESLDDFLNQREVRGGSVGGRLLESLLDGGKNGVNVGMAIIPGVLVICTIVMMLTNGPSADGTYTGAAYEGVALLPWIGEKIDFIFCSGSSDHGSWSCRSGNWPCAGDGKRRHCPRKRYCCVYGNVYVLERIFKHTCRHDVCPELSAYDRKSYHQSYDRRSVRRSCSKLYFSACRHDHVTV